MNLVEKIKFWAVRLVREPLFHFLAVGLVLFGASEYQRRAQDQYRIVIAPERVEWLKAVYKAEFGAPPPDDMVETLVHDYVQSEVLFREGMARGLDDGDEIVRRRIIQKATFLEQGVDALLDPDEARLRAWFDANRGRYVEPGRVNFSHVFFAAEPGEEQAVREWAEHVRSGLPADRLRAPELGDPFPDLHDFSGFAPDEARRLFGDSEISRKLFSAPVGAWSGPYRSSFGWHIVRVSDATKGQTQPFESVRDAVLDDYREEARREADEKRLKDLVARYRVVRDDK